MYLSMLLLDIDSYYKKFERTWEIIILLVIRNLKNSLS